MRILVFSDIHSNLTALEAVLAAAGNVDAYWCLGDLVGYGPDPNECIALVRDLPNLVCVRGNHDAATLGEVDQNTFNHEASLAITWTKRNLNAESQEFLLSLPERLLIDDITLVHGSPRNPVWDYIMDAMTAERMFQFFDTRICLVGHTHVPAIWKETESESPKGLVLDYQKVKILTKSILNPGSVGQPRDHDPRAAFAIFDPQESLWELRRVPYKIAEVQARIKKSGLPWRHALRLSEGW
ncbi:MAG: metallophosphoesterase [Anaerolineae bacterium]|jgi:diadenosine tetraphosphatase ApaH/serine/threonine PP2A family protein phosphatase|nr:metallophosphoesterase [Anaerolineae bacterium]